MTPQIAVAPASPGGDCLSSTGPGQNLLDHIHVTYRYNG